MMFLWVFFIAALCYKRYLHIVSTPKITCIWVKCESILFGL